MLTPHNEKRDLAKECKALLGEVSFPDLATRQLFENLIKQSEQTATLLAEQKIL